MSGQIKTIFIAAYRAFSVRYILESEIFQTLRKMPVRLVILHPDFDSDYFREHFSGENVVLASFPYDESTQLAKGSRLAQGFKQIRYCAYGGQNENETGTRKIFESYHFKGLRGTAIRVLARICRASRLARQALVALESRMFVGREAQPLFDQYKPALMIASSVGYGLDCPIMRQARKNGCPVMSIVHSWDNPSSKGYRGAAPDFAVAWNGIMKDELVRYHDIAPESIYVGGVAHWDSYFREGERCSREEFLARHRIPAGRKIVFYAPSGPKHILTTLDQVEFLLHRIRGGAFGTPCHLIMRVHPAYMAGESGHWAEKFKADLERVKRLAEEYADCVTFNFPEVIHLRKEFVYPIGDMFVYADILRHADVMVTEYSTCMIEACIFDLPVVNVAYQNWRDTSLKTSETLNNLDHLRRIFATGAVRHANSQEELVALVQAYLKDRSLDTVERRKVVEQECSANKGSAGKRIADHICSVLQQSSDVRW